jgi:hypothetical protein
MKLKDLNLLSVGNTIQLAGAIWQGEGKTFLCYFPKDAQDLPLEVLEMTLDEWLVFIKQTDLLETEILTKASDGTIAKAIFRKSQRQIDASVQWRVFKRDSYKCRYCGKDDVALTVDHLILWEEGGPSTPENLVAACKKCNRSRGSMPYAAWLISPYYLEVSKGLSATFRADNQDLVETLARIPRVVHTRSR